MEIKICPQCSVEYFARVDKCADCGVTLLFPGEIEKHRAKEAELLEQSAANIVSIREGGKDWIHELQQEVLAAGIPCRLSLAPGCKAGECGTTFHLLVTSDAAEAATKVIEKYYRETHPEILESESMAAEGKCPACGHPAGPEARECPDCGLVLVIDQD